MTKMPLIVWGTAEIGRAIGLTSKQAQYLLSTGTLKGAVKIGREWAITWNNLTANFGEPSDPPADYASKLIPLPCPLPWDEWQ